MKRLLSVSLAISLFSLCIGCAEKPAAKSMGDFSLSELEAFVVEDAKTTIGLDLVNLELDPAREMGSFTGNCLNGDGLSFQVEVTQEPNRISWKAVHKQMTFSGSKSR